MIVVRGRVTSNRAHRVEAKMRGVRLGDRVSIRARGEDVAAVVVAAEGARTVLSLLDDARRVNAGRRCRA